MRTSSSKRQERLAKTVFFNYSGFKMRKNKKTNSKIKTEKCILCVQLGSYVNNYN